MRILFIENKYKTGLWSILAKQLSGQGHCIEYLVQNPLFRGKYGKNHLIPFPKKKGKIWSLDGLEKIINADRNLNYYGAKNKNYFGYYFQKIDELLSTIKPDLIIGESTLFHELLTIEAARRKSILYLNPSSCRYPPGRFSFYKYNTLEPYEGSNEILTQERAIKIIDGIQERSLLPDYMKSTLKPGKNKKLNMQHLKFKLFNPFIMSLSWLIGERYNTPSPWRKMKLEKQKKQNIKRWNSIAENKSIKILEGSFAVLYPLQMQPEANIDVWGNKYRKQTKLIMDIHKQLKNGEKLIVKANPKPKYELEPELLNFIEQHENIYIPPVNWRMEQVLPVTDLIVTVSGTIAIEASLIDKPVVTLTKTFMNNISSSKYLADIDMLSDVIKQVKGCSYKPTTLVQKVQFINYLNEISYSGIWNAPFLDETVIKKKNIIRLFQSIADISK